MMKMTTTTMMRMMMVVVVGVVVMPGRGCQAQRSIVWVHGILSDAQEFSDMEPWIQLDYPNATTYALTCYPNLQSIAPVWTQLDCFSKQLTQIMNTSPDGVKLICFSQDTDYLKLFFPHLVRDKAYLFFYTKEGQQTSVGNYWNDPHQRAKYLENNIFLTTLNNETNNPRSLEFKHNFLRLKNLIMIGGPQDGVIGPWQSSHFAFYDADTVVQPMMNQSWYLNDAFGLQTLERTGRIHTYVIPGIHHTHWPITYSVYEKCIKPWLA